MADLDRADPIRRAYHGEAVYLTDMARCEPASALTTATGRHRWRLYPYTTDDLSGTLMLTGAETDPPEITLRLDRRGWHDVVVGIHRETESEDFGDAVQVRLTGDPAFTALTVPPGKPLIEEAYFKTADLTGQALVFSQLGARTGPGDDPGSYRGRKARVAYVKLVPLTDEEAAAVRADASRRDVKRLFAHSDAHINHFLFVDGTREALLREIEPYRHADVGRLYWECGGGDLSNYFGKVPRPHTIDNVADFDRVGDRLHAEGFRAWRARGEDPFGAACDFAHEIGLEFHASYRTAGFFYPPPLDVWNHGGFYEKHPELRAVGRDGAPAPRISYSYPETRRFAIAYLREVAELFPVDGICLIYVRRPPLVEYEPPLVDGFRAEFGDDPRRLDPREARWLAYRCRTLTQFMRDLRQELDAAHHPRRSRRLEVTAIVSGVDQDNVVNGMDVRAWIADGTVDTLVPYTTVPALNSRLEAWTEPGQIAYWVELTRGTRCRLAPDILPRLLSPEDYRRKAATLYGAGVENLFFWDTAGRVNHTSQASWVALARLGHREEIAAWQRAGEPSLEPPRPALRTLGGWNFAYQTPG